MKKLLIFLSLAVVLASCAGTPKKNQTNEALNKAISECRQYKGAKVVELGAAMADFIKGIIGLAGSEDEEAKEALDVMKDITGFTVLAYADCSDEDKKVINAKLDPILDNAEVLMEAVDDGKKVQIFGTFNEKNPEIVHDVIIYVKSECALVCMFGSISMDSLDKIVK